MLGLPENEDLKKLIHWTYDEHMFMLTICHGPDALLAAGLNGDENSFIYQGSKTAAFPDAINKQTPIIGFMPGNIP